jgi:hypothetical protein
MQDAHSVDVGPEALLWHLRRLPLSTGG